MKKMKKSKKALNKTKYNQQSIHNIQEDTAGVEAVGVSVRW